MFDVNRLNKIVMEVTQQFRKGEEITTEKHPGLTVTHLYMMPHTDDAEPGLEMVDMWFINVGVDQTKAEKHRAELVEILNQWPLPEGTTEARSPGNPLTGGLSYIAFGGTLGSQDLALMLMALGKVLGFWKVITPAILDLKYGDPKGDGLAGAGFVMASGYKPESVTA